MKYVKLFEKAESNVVYDEIKNFIENLCEKEEIPFLNDITIEMVGGKLIVEVIFDGFSESEVDHKYYRETNTWKLDDAELIDLMVNLTFDELDYVESGEYLDFHTEYGYTEEEADKELQTITFTFEFILKEGVNRGIKSNLFGFKK